MIHYHCCNSISILYTLHRSALPRRQLVVDMAHGPGAAAVGGANGASSAAPIIGAAWMQAVQPLQFSVTSPSTSVLLFQIASLRFRVGDVIFLLMLCFLCHT